VTTVRWNEGWRLGVAKMDRQHERIVGLLAGLESACAGGSGEALEEAAAEALDYIDYHFTMEQRLMEEWDYPELGEHVDEHDDYMVQAADDLAMLQDGAEPAGAVLGRLADWWAGHLAGPDRRLAEFLREHGVK